MALSWAILPASVAVVFIIGTLTTYLIAVYKGDVDALFPYISDTGVELPERCIFSEFVNICAVLAFTTMVLRYILINELSGRQDARLNSMNRVSIILASLSCLGLSLVANFQEQGMEVVHLTGASMVFGFGVVYALLDTSISYRMCPQYSINRKVCRLRLMISLLTLTFLLGAAISGGISSLQWNHSGVDIPHSRHWKPIDPGYNAHLVSTFCEWGLGVFFVLYFATHIPDFHKFGVNVGLSFYVIPPVDMEPGHGGSPIVRSTLEADVDPDENTRLIHT